MFNNKKGRETVLDVRKLDCLYRAVQHIAIIRTNFAVVSHPVIQTRAFVAGGGVQVSCARASMLTRLNTEAWILCKYTVILATLLHFCKIRAYIILMWLGVY